MFIVFEGLDGSGSSTHSRLLKENLEKNGQQVAQTKEPTNLPIGKLIRQFLQHKHKTTEKALQLLFAADRLDHLSKIIKPKQEEGKIVISDRYFFSSIAFGTLKSAEMFPWLEELYKDFPLPDMIFLLKVPPSECMKRIQKREQIEFFEQEEILKKVWKNYEKLANKYPDFHIIDGLKPKEDNAQTILNLVQKKLNN